MTTSYGTDFVIWSQEQAKLLREGQLSQLDIEHVAEEIEAIGFHERRELKTTVAQLLRLLLLWRASSGERAQTYAGEIAYYQLQVISIQDDSPSLRSYLVEQFPAVKALVAEQLGDQIAAGLDSGLICQALSEWSLEEVLQVPWKSNSRNRAQE